MSEGDDVRDSRLGVAGLKTEGAMSLGMRVPSGSPKKARK